MLARANCRREPAVCESLLIVLTYLDDHLAKLQTHPPFLCLSPRQIPPRRYTGGEFFGCRTDFSVLVIPSLGVLGASAKFKPQRTYIDILIPQKSKQKTETETQTCRCKESPGTRLRVKSNGLNEIAHLIRPLREFSGRRSEISLPSLRNGSYPRREEFSCLQKDRRLCHNSKLVGLYSGAVSEKKQLWRLPRRPTLCGLSAALSSPVIYIYS
ncbi:hypothetical protein K438DRAFT_306477 [Mycena galopus ATCC 62051]|nr:hypothetical protein K438DRAFT_306477 [Mycena galopus ATCC 62051]